MQPASPAEADPGLHRKLLLLVAGGFLLRIASLFIIEPSLTSDSLIYHNLARSLVDAGRYASDGAITAYRPPGYPFFLAAISSLAGSGIVPVRILQSVIDALTCVLVFRFGRRLFSPREGLIGAAILSVYPPQLLYSQALLSETLFTFLFIFVLDTVAGGIREGSGGLRAGVLLGICVYLKPFMVVFPLVAAGWSLLAGGAPKHALRWLLVTLVVTGVFMMPWLVRNRVELGSWIFTTNGGVNLWIGNNPQASGAYSVPADNDIFGIEGEVARDRRAFHEAVRFMETRPLHALKLVPWKFFFFFSSESTILLQFFEGARKVPWDSFAARYLSVPTAALLAVNLPYYLLVLLSLPALLLGDEREGAGPRSLILAILVFWLGVYLVFFGSSRFHMPIMPLLALCAARSVLRSRALLSGASGFRITLLICSLLGFFVMWVGEWIGLVISL